MKDASLALLDKPMTVAEAAKRLDVSQRTIYRLVKSGQLSPLKTQDRYGKTVRLIVTKNVNDESDLSQNSDRMAASSDDVAKEKLDETIAELRADITHKEAEIARLTEAQAEMRLTIGKLQDQLIELSKAILVQNQSLTALPKQENAAPNHRKNEAGVRSRLARLFRSSDKK